MASQLLQANANVHAVDNDGYTALHYAAWYGRARVADVLLQANASTTAVDKAGLTSGQRAEQTRHRALAERLRQAQPVGSSRRMGVGGRAVYRLGVLRRGVLRTPKDAWSFWDGTHIDLFPTFRLRSPTLMSRVRF